MKHDKLRWNLQLTNLQNQNSNLPYKVPIIYLIILYIIIYNIINTIFQTFMYHLKNSFVSL